MSERWGTPPEIAVPLKRMFPIDLDAAADSDLHVVQNYITKEQDALSGKEWPGQVVFCNPPYGRKLEPFVRECERQARVYGKVVIGLFPFRCRAAWWHDCVIGRAIDVLCVRKRVKFLRPDGTRGAFTGSCDSCIVVWGGQTEDIHTRLGRFEPEFQEAA